MARTVLLNAATAVSTGATMDGGLSNRTYQATVKGTGTVGATVIIEATNDGENFLTLGTITLTGASPQSDGFASSAQWAMVRARIPAGGISGTGAAVTAVMGG